MRARSLMIVVGGLCLAAWVPDTVHADGPAFVPGDLIVKFATASDVGAQVARAQHAKLVAQELVAFSQRLTQELGVAVSAVRVTSGSELVLSVDRVQLLASLSAVVRRHQAVRKVSNLAAPETVLPAARIGLLVEFQHDSEAAQLVIRSLHAGTTSSREIDALVRELCAGVDPLPSGRVVERDRLLLSVDVAALTLQLIDRLQHRPDVEYVQPSHILRPVNGK